LDWILFITSKKERLGRPSHYWDVAAKGTHPGQNYDELLAEHYRLVHTNLIEKWTKGDHCQVVLKTDLFAEAMCPSRSFAWDMIRMFGGLFGMDISNVVCRSAKESAAQYVPIHSLQVTTCDVRRLPFANGSFDLIVSDSTLDHFESEKEIDIALSELTRVLRTGGILIITMDNKSNITEPIFRLWAVLGLSPFFIGKTYSARELEKALAQNGMSVMDKTAIMHNPRFFARLMVSVLRKIQPHKANGRIEYLLRYFDSLEYKRTKYLTAQYIAMKATKLTGGLV
jgi:ubiquinone/menaquinone biosynthesis C-methylase UbiE